MTETNETPIIATDEELINAGEFLVGAAEMIESLAKTVGKHRAFVNRKLVELYGEQAGDGRINFNFTTREVTFLPSEEVIPAPEAFTRPAKDIPGEV